MTATRASWLDLTFLSRASSSATSTFCFVKRLLFGRPVQSLSLDALKLPGSAQFVSGRLSIVDETGETDILVDLRLGEERAILLIENKIDAAFQLAQPEVDATGFSCNALLPQCHGSPRPNRDSAQETTGCKQQKTQGTVLWATK
ncbi:hypothetical protein [Jiella pelagia]|uniref:Uncharacterized protein n=1 Tax=Jiella pelagia TaxID=2986949 RepID=A0ABY7C6G6_9HYPH|nr:hypothetical protein [Jiella pelagia]WAP70378.1 hypothetical protein OH818_10080 [Jiella pelagia]